MFGKKKTKVEHIQEETYDPYWNRFSHLVGLRSRIPDM